MAEAAARQRRAVQALHDPALSRARAKAARMIHEQRAARLSPPRLTPHSPDRAESGVTRETLTVPASQRLQPSPAKRKHTAFGASEYGRAFRDLVEHRSGGLSTAGSPEAGRLRQGESHATFVNSCAVLTHFLQNLTRQRHKNKHHIINSSHWAHRYGLQPHKVAVGQMLTSGLVAPELHQPPTTQRHCHSTPKHSGQPAPTQ